VVDQILRNQIDTVAEVMRVTPRTALGYAPADLPTILAERIVEAARSLPPTTASCGRRPPLHLIASALDEGSSDHSDSLRVVK
jgi:hypothetical protein